jgi:hypothetical protein
LSFALQFTTQFDNVLAGSDGTRRECFLHNHS